MRPKERGSELLAENRNANLGPKERGIDREWRHGIQQPPLRNLGSLTKTLCSMLDVSTRLADLAGMPEGPAKERLRAANHEAMEWARSIRSSSRRDGCDEHTDEPSHLTVEVQRDGWIHLEKTDFCCDAFADRYDFLEHGRRRPQRRAVVQHGIAAQHQTH